MPLDFPNPADSTTYTDPTSGNTYTFANGSWSIANLLPASKGGTGFASYTRGDFLFGNSSGTLSKLAAGTSGYVLSTNGSGADPTWIAQSGAGLTIASGSDGQIAFYSGTGTSITSSSAFSRNTSTGTVSIDMSDASYALHIRGGGNVSKFRYDTNGSILHLSAGSGNSAELRLYTGDYTYYTGFKPNATANVTYILPSNKPSTGTSVLQSDSSGNLTWVAMTASGGGAGTVATPGAQYQIAGYYQGTGASVSGSSTFTNNTSSGIVSITHATGSTSPSFGALLVSGGVGIAGTLSYYKSQLGVAGTSSLPSMAFIGNTNNPVYLNVLENNALSFEGYHGQLLSISPDLVSGYVFSVGDISGIPLLRANANANVTANEYGGNFGIGTTNPGYKLEVSGQTAITGSTASISTSTGALIVTGGVGIGGSLNVGSLSKFSNVLEIRSGNELRLYRTADTNYTVLKSADVTANRTFTLPLTVGSNGQFLTTDGAGVLSFTTDPIQTNSGNQYEIAFYSSAGSSVYGSNTFKNDTNVGKVSITHTTASSSVSTGALVVSGGVGIGGTLYVGSGIAAVSTTSGDVVVTGGVGIGGSLRIGDSTATGSVASGALVVSGGVGVGGGIYVQSTSQFSGNLTIQGSLTMNAPLQAFNLTSPFKKINSISLSMSGNGWTNGAVIQVQQANIKETSTAANGTVTLVVPAIAFRKQSFSATNSGVTFTRAANVYIEDAPDSSVTGASGAGSTNTVTITNSYALYVENGKTLFGGAIYSGGNTFTKNPGTGDIAFDNGSKDTPGSLYYWDNNKNFGTDVYFSGSGTTRYRIVKELNESGGAELWSIDRDGVVYRTNWAVGETVNTALYNYSDLGMSGTTTISSTSYTTVATISYTPKSSSSYLWIEFSATYNIAGGGGDDFWSNIEVGGVEQVNSNQIWGNGAGGGTRSGVLFPLSARYTNSGTSSLTITVRVKRGTSDDNATIYGNAASGYMRIQEVQR